jgi:hypothetical protein
MTKKTAKKTAARARKEDLGGKYQHHLRQVGGADGGTRPSTLTKYVHVHQGTAQGTTWLLSDEAIGAVLRIAVPEGPLTPEVAEEAFAGATYPLVNETSDDGGRTWVQHLDVGPQRDWTLARRLIYSLLGTGGGRWKAARIRARTGEDLVRHPPKLLQDVAEQIQAAVPGAQCTLQAPNDQLFVRVGMRTFAMATSMKRATTWPFYVTPIPPTTEAGGSWECFSIEDVLSTLKWPDVQPSVRIASVEEIRNGIISEPMRKDVLVRRLGDGPPDAHYVNVRFDDAKGETFEGAVRALRREAETRTALLEAGVRRTDRAGHPFVCTWTRRAVRDEWTFSWGPGADDPSAEPLPLVDAESGAFVYQRDDEPGATSPSDGFFVFDERGTGPFIRK